MKLFRDTVSALLFDTLEKLFTIKETASFRLVGGTALSLQLGHRQSDDIDLFTGEPYGTIDFPLIYNAFRSLFDYTEGYDSSNVLGISCFVGHSRSECVKLDMYHADPFVYPPVQAGDIIISSLEDIILMKLGIIASPEGGRKKDFWDIHELLQHFPLEWMVEAYSAKTPAPLPVPELLAKLETFDRADNDFTPRCLRGKYWELIKLDISEEVTCLKASSKEL